MPKDMTLIMGIGKPKGAGAPPPSFPKRPSADPKGAALVIGVGGPKAGEPDGDEAKNVPPAGGSAGASVAISPEAVCFRSAEETCGNCAHMGGDGNCQVLNTPVAPGDGCKAFSANEQGVAESAPEEVIPQ